MKVNLLQKIVAIDADGTEIKGNGGTEHPTVKELALFVLRQAHADDQRTGYKEKQARYLLVTRLNEADEIELADGEVEQILERAGKVLLQIELIGKLTEALQGEIK